MSCQPVIGNADYPQDLYLAHGAEHVGEPEADEAVGVAWMPVDQTPAMIARGDILGAITIIGLQHVLLRRAALHLPPQRRPLPSGPATGRQNSAASGCAASGYGV
jgi:hypothetical protein